MQLYLDCVLCIVLLYGTLHQPISTSEMCLAVFFVILILGALGGKIGEIVLKWGFRLEYIEYQYRISLMPKCCLMYN